MKAKELRIGNLVTFQDNQTIFQVNEISETGLGVENDVESTWIELERFEPITLTNEWLLKLGFYENRTGNPSWQLDVNLGFCIWGRPGKGFNVYVNSDEIGNPILYVHQLQNLYFALTGCELEIK